MNISVLSLSLVCLAVSPIAAWATDLSKIDRTIAKEPVYKHKPKYCLLVFGQQATTRVWLVQDGDVLYVDRNGNGDLTEPGETVPSNATRQTCVAGDITCVPGKAGHTDLKLRKYGSVIEMSLWYDDQRYNVGHQEAGPLVFADCASEAPVAHLGGPLSIELSYFWLKAKRPVSMSLGLRVRVGTPGLGKGVFAARRLEAVKPPVFPVADIEFPAKDGGTPPIVTKATLKEH